MQSRRKFISTAGLMCAAASTIPLSNSFSQDAAPAVSTTARLKKTLKLNMVKSKGSLSDKFALVRDAGFAGVELDAPGFDIEEAKAAMQATGIVIDGTVNVDHWQVRHTDPDPASRTAALLSCINGLRATAAVGGDTMLLVAGHGKDGTPAEVFDRAVANIRLAIPVAEEVGVKIAIENVWNHFLYDHEGGTDQTAEELARFIDTFDSPWVGVQFDIGNHWKYGDPAGWIRTLGDRIIKLDVKGFSRKRGAWTQMSDSDIVWADVRQALQAIDFRGWVAAEMESGDLEYLKRVSKEMDELLVG